MNSLAEWIKTHCVYCHRSFWFGESSYMRQINDVPVRLCERCRELHWKKKPDHRVNWEKSLLKLANSYEGQSKA